MSYGYPTSRRYPRTLAEAFPCERAAAIEHEPRVIPWADRVLGVLLALSIAGALVALIFNEIGG